VHPATFAAFLAVYHHNVTSKAKIQTLVFPALGTGFGSVPFDESARQMAAAYRHYLSSPHRLDWDTAMDRQKSICYDADCQLFSA
jgi:O-acetyl-ADP-ribose deacetylase (regulator of RNase III)